MLNLIHLNIRFAVVEFARLLTLGVETRTRVLWNAIRLLGARALFAFSVARVLRQPNGCLRARPNGARRCVSAI